MSYSVTSRGPLSFVLSDLEQKRSTVPSDSREAYNAALAALSRLTPVVGSAQHDVSVAISGHTDTSERHNDSISVTVAALDLPIPPDKVSYPDDAANAALAVQQEESTDNADTVTTTDDAAPDAPPASTDAAPEPVDPLTEGGA